jgi:hypothetical protein
MVKTNMKSYYTISLFGLLLALGLSGCMSQAPVKTAKKEPEQLFVYADGSMEFRNRKINADEVIIYKDGRGGEKAAVKLSLEPLHPAFFRDSIVVVRKSTDS